MLSERIRHIVRATIAKVSGCNSVASYRSDLLAEMFDKTEDRMIASLQRMEQALRMVWASWLKRTTCDVHKTCIHCPMINLVIIDGAKGFLVGKKAVKRERKLPFGWK